MVICTSNQYWAWFCAIPKLSTFVLKSNMNIPKQPVWETQKFHHHFSRSDGSWVIDQNVINILLINSKISAWPTEILMPPLNSQTIGRMRTPVREAFSYGIRHRIRHILCDSLKYDLMLHWITMNMPYPVPYPVLKCLPCESTHPP